MEELEQLGFSKNLQAVYLCVLRNSKLKAGGVIQETGLQRSVVYSALDGLTNRGIISKTISQGVAVFSANDPSALVDEAENKRKLAETLAQRLKEKQDVSNREAVVYEGNDIIERITNKSLEVLESGDTVYFLGAAKYGIAGSLEKYWQKYHKQRMSKGIQCKILYDKDTSPRTVKERGDMEGSEAKYMPFGSDLPMWFTIFGEYVAMIVPSEEPPLAFLIKSKATALALKAYFDFLWNYDDLTRPIA